MAKSLLLVLLALSLSSFVSGTIESDPGVKVTVSQDAITDLLDDLTPLVTSTLDGLTFPNVTGGDDPTLTVTNLNLTNMGLSNATTQIYDTYINFCFESLTFDLEGDWIYTEKTIFEYKSTGSFTAELKGSEICGDIIPSLLDGRPQVNVTNVEFDVEGWSLQIHGNILDGFYDLLLFILKPFIKDVVVVEIDQNTELIMTDAINEILDSIGLTFNILDLAEFDYALNYGVLQPDEYVTVGVSGDFIIIDDPTLEDPYQPGQLPDELDAEAYIEVFLDQSLLENGAWVFYEVGLFDILITQNDLPSDSPISLNTDYFAALIPGLYVDYPNWPMEIEVNATSTPEVTFEDGALNLNAPSQWIFYVIDPSTDVVSEACILDVVFEGTGEISIYQDTESGQVYLSLTFEELKTKMSVYSTNIGVFSPFLLQKSVNEFISIFVLPEINDLGKRGLPLPLPTVVTLVDPVTTIEEGYLAIETNFTLNLPNTTLTTESWIEAGELEIIS